MTYFSSKTFDFLTALAANNSRDWFHDHKADYEANLRQPFLRLIADLQPDLAAVSGHYRSDPKPVGGSLFRIHRDTRFSGNKTPYKTWAGARLFHERARQVPAPSFYLHVQPGKCFVGAGLWHPETPTLRRVRDFIVENPSAWQKAAHDPIFRRRYRLDDSETLVRPPRGYPADHPLIDDLRHKNFVALRSIDDAIVTGPRLRPTLAKDLADLAPLVDYLCAALELDF